MQEFFIVLSVIAGYLLGSIPTSVITGRLVQGIDIREHGSGNAGATNTVRVLGGRWGLIVGLIDLGKGALAVLIPLWLGMDDPVRVGAGVAAVTGHVFPLFAKFRGGKGVATAAGMVLGLYPAAFFPVLGLFAVVLIFTGIVSVASISAAISLPFSVYFLGGGAQALETGNSGGIFSWVFSIALAVFVIILHRKNIGRLLRGEEKRFEKIRIFSRKKSADEEKSDNDR